MPAIRMGLGEQIVLDRAASAQGSVPSSAIGGLSSRQVVFGSPSGGVAQSALFEWDSTQNFLGIGTTNPSAQLHIKTPSSADAGIKFEGNSSAVWVLEAGGAISGRPQTFHLYDAVVGNFRFVMSTSGDFALGPTAPSAGNRLEVQSTAGVQHVVVNSSGHVGIGTTAPAVKFEVESQTTAFKILTRFENASSEATEIRSIWVNEHAQGEFDIQLTSNGDVNFSQGKSASTGAYNFFAGHMHFMPLGSTVNEAVLTSQGRLGLGTTAPATLLDVAGNARLGLNGNNSLGFFGSVGSTQPSTYTTAAITTGRVFPSTASISTFSGVSGSGAGFTSRADMEAFVRVVAQMYEDLRSLNILR